MILSRIEWELAVVVVVLCVAAIFFFPAIQGPYSAVNGPVSALQASQAAARLRLAIVQAAFNMIWNFKIPSLAWPSSPAIVYIEPQASACADCSTILRC